MEIDGQEIDIKAVIKGLERIHNLRFSYLQDDEYEMVYKAIKIFRHMINPERSKRIYDLICNLADSIPDYGENEEEYNKYFEKLIKEATI